MRLALAHARAETRQLFRYPAYSVPTLVFPALLLLLLGRAMERGEPERLLAGFAATALLTIALFQFGVGIALSRTTPWETFLRTLPVSPAARLGGRVLSALVFAAGALVVVSVVAFTVHGARPEPLRFGALVALLLAGCVPFALLGIALGYLLPPRAAVPVANVLFLPLAIAGSLWTRPTPELPRSLDLVSQLLPTRSWIEVLDAVATGDSPLPLHHAAALLGWTVLFGVLAAWAYRRDEGERFT